MTTVLIMMAGSGQRMNSQVNKVLLKLNNEYIFMMTIKKFMIYDLEIILVVNKNDYFFVKELCPNLKIIIGGATRQESVFNGLKEVTTKYTIIHDAARCFISEDVIRNIIDNLKDDLAIMVYDEVVDTIKKLKGEKLVTLERSSLIKAQTPQAASTDILIKCHQKALSENFSSTDDISLIEKYSDIKIKLIKSNLENFKITNTLDYQIAKMLVGDKSV